MKPTKLVALIALVFTFSSAFGAGPKKVPLINSGEVIKEAVKEHDDKNYAKAIELFNSIPKNDTNYSYALSEKALTYIVMSDSINAIRVCKEGIALNDQYIIRYYQLLGNAYHSADSIDKAIATYKKGIELFPYTYKFWYELGVLYYAEKMDTSAVNCFQKAVGLNPLNAASHYYLGILAARNNKFTCSILSLSFYALLDNDEGKGITGLSKIQTIAKGEYVVKKDSVVDILHGNDNFDEIEELVRSKVAINEKYKTNVKLPYTDVVKTIQMVIEKLEYHAADKGFWMQTYVPLYMEIWKNKQFPGMMYSSFSGTDNDEVRKICKSHEKDIKEMISSTSSFVRYKMKREPIVVKGKTYTGFPTTYNDGSSRFIGDTDPVTGNSIGDWVYFYEGGTVKSYGTFDKSGKSQGEWNYYYPNGKYKKKIFWKDSEFDGVTEEYYENGALKEKDTYKNGILEGPIVGFYSTGEKSLSANYSASKIDGAVKLYHGNGLLRIEYNSVKDVIDGPYTEYFYNGHKKLETSYSSGKENGMRTDYYSNGSILSKSKVENAMYVGEFVKYHMNGKISSQGNFKQGKREGLWKSFYDDGVLSTEENYEGGLLVGSQKDYDVDGKLTSERICTKTEIKKYKCFDKAGNIVSQGEAKGGDMNFVNYYPDGKTIISQFTIKDKLIEGKAKYYFPNGILKAEYTYVHNIKDGPAKFYYLNGNLEKELNYKDDEADGYFIGYTVHGDIKNEGWYVKDNMQGRWITYNSNGTFSQDEYYIDNEERGLQHYFDDYGYKSSDQFYDDEGLFQSAQEFDTLGNTINTAILEKGAGPFITVNLDKSIYQTAVYKNGRKDGFNKFQFPNGKVYLTKNFKNGQLNGDEIYYYENGKVQSIAHYTDDDLDSVVTTYNDDGIVTSTFQYFNGERDGESKVFSDDGKLIKEGIYKNGEREGDFIYYSSQNKMVRFKMKYRDGIPVSYSYKGKDDQYVPEIPITSGKMNLVTYYSNGNKSAEMEFFNSFYHGLRKYYYPSGKIESECNFKNDDFDGAYTEYFENGKIQTESTYSKDEITGLQKIYNEQGVLIERGNYIYGLREGELVTFDPTTGKPKKKTIYIRNFPFEKL